MSAHNAMSSAVTSCAHPLFPRSSCMQSAPVRSLFSLTGSPSSSVASPTLGSPLRVSATGSRATLASHSGSDISNEAERSAASGVSGSEAMVPPASAHIPASAAASVELTTATGPPALAARDASAEDPASLSQSVAGQLQRSAAISTDPATRTRSPANTAHLSGASRTAPALAAASDPTALPAPSPGPAAGVAGRAGPLVVSAASTSDLFSLDSGGDSDGWVYVPPPTSNGGGSSASETAWPRRR
jgi:hypothetical protein